MAQDGTRSWGALQTMVGSFDFIPSTTGSQRKKSVDPMYVFERFPREEGRQGRPCLLFFTLQLSSGLVFPRTSSMNHWP